MNKKSFFAQQWLQREDASASDEVPQGSPRPACPNGSRFPTFVYRQETRKVPVELNDRFSPLHCFVPGWKGDSLPSRSVVRFQNLLTRLQHDIKNDFFKSREFPKKIKLGLYQEFLSFAEYQGLHFNGLDNFGAFWQLIHSDALAEHAALIEFVDIYAYRVATMTFLKLRFVAALSEQSGLALSDKALLYPTSFLSQIFKSGSQTALNSEALESNLYSWYSPTETMKETMKDLIGVSQDLAITEIIKNVSWKTQTAQGPGRIYSHALSHLSMGLFLNSLQINFPLWLETLEGGNLPAGNLEDEQIISCKYFGDYLESLSLSHWLAQENNKAMKWDQILCPAFKGREFTSGKFTKLCNELQFLTFLAHKAPHQGVKPIEWICKVMGRHFQNRKSQSSRQKQLLDDHPFTTSTYDRVVLNLCQFPKNNPQHFLMAQVQEQVEYLKPNGYLFVLSSKKLFVPSLRERLESALKDLKLEAIFDLENVKGKGELGSYIYVFRKKAAASERQLCSYFRITADLTTFQEFSSITEHLRSFYLSHLNEAPAMTQIEFPGSFRLDYFQEAIVSGMLIHSASEDSGRITHPTYFKSLLEHCVPLDTLFDIRPLAEEKSSESSLNLGLKRDLSFFLVVDFRKPEVVLALHPMDTLRSLQSDFGLAQCFYFQLQPKLAGLNPNILRNYFQTAVGKQLVQLSFSGGPSLVKGSLSKLLVPKFLTETEPLPGHLKSGFDQLDLSDKELLDSSPSQLLQTFTHLDQISQDLFPRYACEILSRFSRLSMSLENLIWKMEDGRYGQTMSFNNPMIQAKLVQKKTLALYPDNPDIFIEIVDGTPNNIHLPLTQTQLRITHEGELKLYSLELYSGEQVVVRFHAEETLISFLNFILAQATNVPISKLLKAVHLPSLNDLKSVIDSTQEYRKTYQELLSRVDRAITDAFRKHVTPKRPS